MRSTFIGGGNMATAMIGGLLARRRRSPPISGSSSRFAAQRERLAARFPGVGIHPAIAAAAVAGADIVVFAVKPQQMRDAARQLSPFIGAVPLVLIDRRRRPLRRPFPLARRLSADRPRDAEHAGADRRGHQRFVCDTRRSTPRRGERRRGARGVRRRDPVRRRARRSTPSPACPAAARRTCSISSRRSSRRRCELGLDAARRAPARLRDVRGQRRARAAERAEPPATLRANVTSKGGTTARALDVLNAAKVNEHFIAAVKAAAARARELGDEIAR